MEEKRKGAKWSSHFGVEKVDINRNFNSMCVENTIDKTGCATF